MSSLYAISQGNKIKKSFFFSFGFQSDYHARTLKKASYYAGFFSSELSIIQKEGH
jgi:hypothetical protein